MVTYSYRRRSETFLWYILCKSLLGMCHHRQNVLIWDAVCTNTRFPKIEIYSMQCERIWSRLQTCVTNVRRRKYECDALSCSVCKHGQCIVGVHMCDGTNRKERRWEIWFWQWALYPFIIQLALCASFEGQEQPTVEAKLLSGITAMMVILKSFHKSLFFSGPLIGSSTAL